ncbi:MAG: DMT family transporter [Solidesulfovibrio sp. DCME]|uniref:DMT family transporter n=1 Tax=Solidesulfovibrio sp. DCME TaxID=3447380 RepID=UPI003D0C974E
MGNAWVFLFLAGLFEIGWPIGLKLAQAPWRLGPGVGLAVCCMAASGLFLYLAQRVIPMGTAYAVWTGIGAAGAFAVGVLAYGDAASLSRLAGVGLIVAGVATLKLAS